MVLPDWFLVKLRFSPFVAPIRQLDNRGCFQNTKSSIFQKLDLLLHRLHKYFLIIIIIIITKLYWFWSSLLRRNYGTTRICNKGWRGVIISKHTRGGTQKFPLKNQVIVLTTYQYHPLQSTLIPSDFYIIGSSAGSLRVLTSSILPAIPFGYSQSFHNDVPSVSVTTSETGRNQKG